MNGFLFKVAFNLRRRQISLRMFLRQNRGLRPPWPAIESACSLISRYRVKVKSAGSWTFLTMQ